MKILHTAPTLDVSYGGPSTCIYYLLQGLNRIGVAADILTLAAKQNNNCLWNDDFIRSVENDSWKPLLYSRNFKRWLETHHNRYDIFHANTLWTYPSHATALTARKAGLPFVLSPHGMLYPRALNVSSWKKRLALQLFQREDLRQATFLHATCREELQHIRQFGLKNPVVVIPNCLNLSGSDPIKRSVANSIRRIGFVGRIDRIKNIDLLLRAWLLLGGKTREAELTIIGSGDEKYLTELKRFAAAHEMSNVIFAGFLTGKELTQQVRNLDFQVLPSKSENFGMVVPEALINRVPVIASRNTPWGELNVSECGWWIDCDEHTLADTLYQALRMPESTRLEMGENGRKLVMEKYSQEKVASQFKQFYQWALHGGPTPEFVYE